MRENSPTRIGAWKLREMELTSSRFALTPIQESEARLALRVCLYGVACGHRVEVQRTAGTTNHVLICPMHGEVLFEETAVARFKP
jgi:hypothetical protein